MPIYENQTLETIVETIIVRGRKRVFKINPGEHVETTRILTDVNFTKLNDFPRYNPIYQQDTVVSSGSGDNQTIQINLYSSEMSVFNSGSANVLAYLGLLTNYPGIPCHPNTERIILLDYNVEQIIFVFDVAGTVYCEQRV